MFDWGSFYLGIGFACTSIIVLTDVALHVLRRNRAKERAVKIYQDSTFGLPYKSSPLTDRPMKTSELPTMHLILILDAFTRGDFPGWEALPTDTREQALVELSKEYKTRMN